LVRIDREIRRRASDSEDESMVEVVRWIRMTENGDLRRYQTTRIE